MLAAILPAAVSSMLGSLTERRKTRLYALEGPIIELSGFEEYLEKTLFPLHQPRQNGTPPAAASKKTLLRS